MTSPEQLKLLTALNAENQIGLIELASEKEREGPSRLISAWCDIFVYFIFYYLQNRPWPLCQWAVRSTCNEPEKQVKSPAKKYDHHETF